MCALCFNCTASKFYYEQLAAPSTGALVYSTLRFCTGQMDERATRGLQDLYTHISATEMYKPSRKCTNHLGNVQTISKMYKPSRTDVQHAVSNWDGRSSNRLSDCISHEPGPLALRLLPSRSRACRGSAFLHEQTGLRGTFCPPFVRARKLGQ